MINNRKSLLTMKILTYAAVLLSSYSHIYAKDGELPGQVKSLKVKAAPTVAPRARTYKTPPAKLLAELNKTFAGDRDFLNYARNLTTNLERQWKTIADKHGPNIEAMLGHAGFEKFFTDFFNHKKVLLENATNTRVVGDFYSQWVEFDRKHQCAEAENKLKAEKASSWSLCCGKPQGD